MEIDRQIVVAIAEAVLAAGCRRAGLKDGASAVQWGLIADACSLRSRRALEKVAGRVA